MLPAQHCSKWRLNFLLRTTTASCIYNIASCSAGLTWRLAQLWSLARTHTSAATFPLLRHAKACKIKGRKAVKRCLCARVCGWGVVGMRHADVFVSCLCIHYRPRQSLHSRNQTSKKRKRQVVLLLRSAMLLHLAPRAPAISPACCQIVVCQLVRGTPVRVCWDRIHAGYQRCQLAQHHPVSRHARGRTVAR